MSYRDCRNFTEMLRSLGYPRLVSVENFKKPNFELVADILFWLAQRYDPHTEISDNINAEKDRVQFIRSIVTLFSTKARIKLTPRKLYQADSSAVQEMLKITTVLYKVNEEDIQAYNTSGIDEEEAGTFSLPTKISNLKAHKILANEICELGAKLNDSLSREPQLRKSRQEALNFLDSMGRSSDGSNDQVYIEHCVKEIIKQQDQSMAELTKYVTNMEKEQRNLEEKIKKKNAELDRAEKRYKSLVNVKPAFMDEYDRLEAELERLYQVYVEKYRNLDYLEHQLDDYNRIEEDKLKNAQRVLEGIQNTIREEQLKQIRGDKEIDEAMLAADLDNEQNRGVSRGNSRSRQNRANENQNARQPISQKHEQAQHHPQVSEEAEEDVEGSEEEQLEDDEEQEEGEGESDGDF